MKFLIEKGIEQRENEMEDLFLELHKKAETQNLTDEEQGMFDLLMWLYHDEDKPVIKIS